MLELILDILFVLSDATIPSGVFRLGRPNGKRNSSNFCLTAKGGFTRNLTAGEIVAQIKYLKRLNNIPENKSVNIVYMGMGEPLDNYENLVQSIKIISELDGLAISTRRQTISTSGIPARL